MKSPPSKTETLEDRIAKRIARKRGDVFLRADFEGMGGYDQVGRALRSLVQKGKLLKLGYGLYCRVRKSTLTGKLVPPNGLATLTQALRRLGIKTKPTQLQLAYNAGRTAQVPTGRVVAVNKRVRRQIGYDGFALGFERASAARLWKGLLAADAKPTRQQPKGRKAGVTVREVLRLLMAADSYPCLGNGDVQVSDRMEADALALAPGAIRSADDPPEFGAWLAALLTPGVTRDEREEIYLAIKEFFDPEPVSSDRLTASQPP